MTETRICCDRCRAVILEHRSKLVPQCGPWKDTGREPIDLCPDCLESLDAWLKTPAELPGLVLSSG